MISNWADFVLSKMFKIVRAFENFNRANKTIVIEGGEM